MVVIITHHLLLLCALNGGMGITLLNSILCPLAALNAVAVHVRCVRCTLYAVCAQLCKLCERVPSEEYQVWRLML